MRVAFQTLGCRSNYADTVDIQSLLVERGGVPCDFDAEADVYVINTCSVTDNADREALKCVDRALERNPSARVVVTGCFAEVGADKLLAHGGVDAVVAPGKRSEVVDAIFSTEGVTVSQSPFKRSERRSSISLENDLSPATPAPGVGLGESDGRSRFHLRIQEGCDNFCTFCIIPYTRGTLSSRPLERILEDLTRLHTLGYREVILTGTHIGGYGEDINSSFLELLKRISQESPIHRIRLSSIDPNDVSKELIDLLSSSSKFCEHLHLCFQAATDPLLKRMNRRYRLSEAEEILNYAVEKLPGWCIGTDLITGFPGETREDVDAQMSWFESKPLSYVHVFPYSERSGTAAVNLPESVDIGERKRRAARWRALSERRFREFSRTKVGQEVEFVVEKVTEDELTGTTREYVNASLKRSGEFQSIKRGEVVSARALSYSEQGGELQCGL